MQVEGTYFQNIGLNAMAAAATGSTLVVVTGERTSGAHTCQTCLIKVDQARRGIY